MGEVKIVYAVRAGRDDNQFIRIFDKKEDAENMLKFIGAYNIPGSYGSVLPIVESFDKVRVRMRYDLTYNIEKESGKIYCEVQFLYSPEESDLVDLEKFECVKDNSDDSCHIIADMVYTSPEDAYAFRARYEDIAKDTFIDWLKKNTPMKNPTLIYHRRENR